MKASIIIPTKDKLTRLRLVLKFLEHQITDEIEVIIIFDGCNPETITGFAKLDFHFTPLQIVSTENIGRSAARNLGIKLAHGKTIIFLDDDRIPSEDYVKKHLEAQNEPCVLLGERHEVYLTDAEIQNLYFLNDPTDIYRQIKTKANRAVESAPNIRRRVLLRLNRPSGWMDFYTGNVSVPRNELLKAGCFDENFRGWGHEDLELGYRLHKKGVSFHKNTTIVNYHLSHQSNTKQKFRDSKTNLKYMMKKYRNNVMTNLLLRVLLLKIYLERFTHRI